MAVDVGVVADGDVVPDDDTAAIVQQHMAMHDDVVTHLEVVPKRELDVVKAFEVGADALEEVRRENPP